MSFAIPTCVLTEHSDIDFSQENAEMANYIARVALHKADSDDYEQLHTSMANRGYFRPIQGGDESKYQLPTGTYVIR